MYMQSTFHLDSMSSSPVPGSHITVALGDRRAHSQVPVLAVHVVGSRPVQAYMMVYSEQLETQEEVKKGSIQYLES